jgi:hypothetical protein
MALMSKGAGGPRSSTVRLVTAVVLGLTALLVGSLVRRHQLSSGDVGGGGERDPARRGVTAEREATSTAKAAKHAGAQGAAANAETPRLEILSSTGNAEQLATHVGAAAWGAASVNQGVEDKRAAAASGNAPGAGPSTRSLF